MSMVFYPLNERKRLSFGDYVEEYMELKGKKIIILIEQMFNEHEFWYPYYRLKEAGAQVTVVGTGSAVEYQGKSGTETRVDKEVVVDGKLITSRKPEPGICNGSVPCRTMEYQK